MVFPAGTTAAGITGIELENEAFYNVDFKISKYIDIYRGEFDFDGWSDVKAAAVAIIETFTDNNITGVIDGIETRTYFYIPYEDDGNKYLAIESNYSSRWAVAVPPANPNDKAANIMFAKFSAVPIPSAVWLFGAGLIGIVGIRRRFRK